GLSRLNLYSQGFRTLRTIPGEPGSLPDEDVTRMVEGPDGRLWTISRNGVVSAGDPRTGAFVQVPFEGSPLAIGFAGSELFVGTATGLKEIDAARGRTVPLPAEVRAAGLDTMRIDALASGDDYLWIVAGGTLYRLATGGRVLHRVRLPSGGEPSSLDPAFPERLWIAYEEGILLRADFANGAITVRSAGDPSIAARGRLAAVAEHRGVLWLGTWLGIGRMRSASGPVEWIEPEEGMPSRSVAAILADDAGVLWIPTNRGITRFDPSRNRAVHFGAAQGAQASGYVDGGAARGRSGLFYVAGRGITVFDPRQVAHDPHRPRVVFTTLEVLHRPVLPSWVDAGSPLEASIHAAEEVELGPDAAVFSVTMAAPGVNDPDGVRFVHRLDGFDEEWVETAANRRVATYTSLAPGRYVLRARARTRSGVWSASEATLRIRILPPWWRTPAAIALWLAIAALATVVLVRGIRNRTRLRIALAEQEALRRASMTDPLTGLYNRRFLTAWLKHEVPRTLRTHRPAGSEEPDREFLLAVLADLDNLKEVNDRLGHDAGDRAISAVADLLQSHARQGDIAVRLGGDEFVLVLRGIDPSQAPQIVERLRASVASLDGDLGEASRPTISLGFASFPFLIHDVEGVSWEQTFQLADRALLHTKRNGRNAWTGFLASPETSAASLRDYLGEVTEQAPPSTIRIIEGPVREPKAGSPAEAGRVPE
ncbi:MAG TPA: diguanylate cyclase, partial [Thermoanaerobaculia bacterium]|nr:diguanylate cyclase [Thermoanaerobaculia bacterium]